MRRLALDGPVSRLSQLHLEPDPATGIYQGDCVRTAIAMLLGCDSPEEVPHLHNFEGECPPGMGWPGMAEWLLARGVQIVHVPLPNWSSKAITERLPNWLGGAPAILQGTTSEGYGHVVAIIDGMVVDTVDYTEGNPIVEPDEDGLFWLTLLLPRRTG